jgi:DNA invertase Pin-like site-specific DNA recombinase
MPKCYAYGRHSTAKQGMTREVQEKTCRDYYDTHLAKKGVEWAGFFYDPAESGGSIFSERPDGRQVYFALQPGDYLVVADMSRLFRNKTDGFVTLDQLDRKGVKRVILDLPDLSGLDGDAELYDMLESNMVLYAHMYRRMVSRKMKRDNQVKRESGLPFSRSSPVGWKQVGTRQQKAYRVNEYERGVIDFMQTQHDEGQSLDDIALWFMHEEDRGRFTGKTIRRFTGPDTVRWALRARQAGYPMITNRKDFQRLWSSGQIALNRA